MWNIPILRSGQAYYSKETLSLQDYATGEPVATVSQANAGLVSRDLLQDAWTDFQELAVEEILQRLGDVQCDTLAVGNAKDNELFVSDF